MKITHAVSWAVAATLLLSTPLAQASPVGKFVCERLSGGPMSSFAMTIDYDAKEIDIPYRTGFLAPDPDWVEITDTSVHWSFMRGFIVFDRRTGILDWDTTDDYAYLEAIDQPSDRPESDFKGRMQCKTDSGRTSP